MHGPLIEVGTAHTPLRSFTKQPSHFTGMAPFNQPLSSIAVEVSEGQGWPCIFSSEHSTWQIVLFIIDFTCWINECMRSDNWHYEMAKKEREWSEEEDLEGYLHPDVRKRKKQCRETLPERQEASKVLCHRCPGRAELGLAFCSKNKIHPLQSQIGPV